MKKFYISAILATAFAAANAATPSPISVFGPKLVTQITTDSKISTLRYDASSRLAEVNTTTAAGNSSAVFDYTPGSFNGREYHATVTISDPKEKIICYIVLNSDGYAIRSYEVEEFMGETAEYETYTFEYDTDGHLRKVNELGYFYNETVTFNIDNERIHSAVKTDNDEKSTYTIGYTDITSPTPKPNIGGVMDFDMYGFGNFEATYLYYAGMLGMPNPYLPIYTQANGSKSAETDRYEWDLSTDSYPQTLRVYADSKLDNVISYTWSETSGAHDIAATSPASEITAYYDITGRRHSEPVNGLNIIKKADGSSVKMIR